MKISRVKVTNIGPIPEVTFKPQEGINVIVSDAPSIGKTTLLQAAYAGVLGYTYNLNYAYTTDAKNAIYGMFAYNTGSGNYGFFHDKENDKASIQIDEWSNAFEINFNGFDPETIKFSGDEHRIDPQVGQMVYIPEEDVISHINHFRYIFEKYHLPFPFTWYKLLLDLNDPYLRNPSYYMKKAIDVIEDVIGGTVIMENNTHFLYKRNGKQLEMSMLSTSERKLAELDVLLHNGSIAEGSILFMDEPTSGFNMSYYGTMCDVIAILAAGGVQIIMATNDHMLLTQLHNVSFNYNNKKLYCDRLGLNLEDVFYRYHSMYRSSESTTVCDCQRNLYDLSHFKFTPI